MKIFTRQTNKSSFKGFIISIYDIMDLIFNQRGKIYMKKGILTSLGLAAVLTLGLASVNEYRDFKENTPIVFEKFKVLKKF